MTKLTRQQLPTLVEVSTVIRTVNGRTVERRAREHLNVRIVRSDLSLYEDDQVDIEEMSIEVGNGVDHAGKKRWFINAIRLRVWDKHIGYRASRDNSAQGIRIDLSIQLSGRDQEVFGQRFKLHDSFEEGHRDGKQKSTTLFFVGI
ncbi:MAG: hypothetical protein CMK32_09580 [Porticoccaceae bacterium]|nr:hypothetical protein [Porticoccaceae bacterium]